MPLPTPTGEVRIPSSSTPFSTPNTWTGVQTYTKVIQTSVNAISTNTGLGTGALASVPGTDNTAIGYQALAAAASNQNTAVGSGALKLNANYDTNCAFGYQAMFQYNNDNSCAFGWKALYCSDSLGAPGNSAFGYQALMNNATGGTGNSAFGRDSLLGITSGASNCGFGSTALAHATIGSENTAIGTSALNLAATSSSNNIGLGYFAGQYQTAPTGMLFIDAYDRTTAANELVQSLIVGTMVASSATTVANQFLYFNAQVRQLADPALSTTTLQNSPYHDLLGQYWNGAASVPYGFRLLSVQDATTPTAHLSFNLNSNGTITELLKLAQAGIFSLYGKIATVGGGLPAEYASTVTTPVSIGSAATTIKAYTPTANGQFLVVVSVEASVATTLSSLTVTYTDISSGVTTTQTLASGVVLALNAAATYTALCPATTAAAITVSATALAAGDLFGSASVFGL